MHDTGLIGIDTIIYDGTKMDGWRDATKNNIQTFMVHPQILCTDAL